MKTSTAALVLSLTANVALLAWLALHAADPADAANASDAAPAIAGHAMGATGKKSTAEAGPASGKTWDRLRTDDLAALVARLRAAGFPDSVVRRIIGSLVNERFDARRLAIEKANLTAPFWTNPGGAYNDPKIGPELRKLQREQTEMMQKLLGGSLADLFAGSDEDRAMLRFQIGDIAPEKLERLYAAAMDYGDKASQAYAAASTGGDRRVMLDSDKEKVAALDKAYRDELAQFLTPTELADFTMRNSQAGAALRNALGPFRPTEDEYRAIYPIYQAFQDQNPTINPANLGADASPAARAAVDQLNSQLAAVLGPGRAADIQQLENPASNQINRLVARLDLPLSAAADVSAVQQDVQQRAAAIRSDDSLTGDARRTQLGALAQEASTKISATLGGQTGLDAYKEYGGQWLNNLVPRPRTATPPAKD